MAAVAAFARSDAGRITAASCQAWGVDPATLLHDDVLGFNLRVALVDHLHEMFPGVEDSQPAELPDEDPVEAAWRRAGAEQLAYLKAAT
jgi:hypothetical protein